MKASRNNTRLHRKRRIRAKVSGTAQRPRVCVYRSNAILHVQLVDDSKGVTIFETDTRKAKKGFSVDGAKEIGKIIAKNMQDSKIDALVFDRGGYRYHGKIKALAESLREEGLKI